MRLHLKSILIAIGLVLLGGVIFINTVTLGQDNGLWDSDLWGKAYNDAGQLTMIENASKISATYESAFSGQYVLSDPDAPYLTSLQINPSVTALGKLGVSCDGGECVVQYVLDRPQAPPLTVDREIGERVRNGGPSPSPTPPPPPPPPAPPAGPPPGPPPVSPSLTFTANPSAIARGATSELSWSSNGSSCLGYCVAGDCWEWDNTFPGQYDGIGETKPTSGTETVSPQRTSTYGLRCFRDSASTYQEVIVSVARLKWREIIPRLFPFLQPIFGTSQ